MTEQDQNAADGLLPTLLATWGEDVELRPADGGAARTVWALFEPGEPDRRHADFDGRTSRPATLHVPEDENPGDDDVYLIRGELWQTDVVGESGGGTRAVMVTRTEGRTARPTGGGVR